MKQGQNRNLNARDELDAVLREHGGIDGLARRIGQGDPLAYRFEPAANENAPPRLITRVRAWFLRLIPKGR